MREVVAVLVVECAHVVVAGLRVRLGNDQLDHRRYDVAAHAPVAAREPELEPALHEQLLFDHAVEHVLALGGADRLAAIRGERGHRAVAPRAGPVPF